MTDEQVTPEPALTDTTVNNLTSKYARLDPADIFDILRLSTQGRTQAEIADFVGCSQATVSNVLKRAKDGPEVTRMVARYYAPKAIEAAAAAMEPAAKRGDSTPALKMLALGHAELGSPAANAGAGGGITINIGAPGQPLALPTVTIDSTPLSPAIPKALSEGE